MKTLICLLFFAAVFTIPNAEAQTTPIDSAGIIKTANHDARHFTLKMRVLREFNKEHFLTSSDYFKPAPRYASNPALLNDSLYVQTFRNAAFYNALNQRTPPSVRDMLLPPHTFNMVSRPVYKAGNEQIAQNDAKKFSLPHDLLKRFKDDHFPNTSDYFKPTAATSDPALLKDSVYVKTFRDEAFYNSLNQRVDPFGHSIIVATSVTVGVLLFLVTLSEIARVN